MTPPETRAILCWTGAVGCSGGVVVCLGGEVGGEEEGGGGELEEEETGGRLHGGPLYQVGLRVVVRSDLRSTMALLWGILAAVAGILRPTHNFVMDGHPGDLGRWSGLGGGEGAE